MMKRILVPTDFSSCADNAVDFAVRMAKTIPAEVILLHTVEPMGPVYTDYMGANKEFHRKMVEEGEVNLEAVKKTVSKNNDVQVTTHVYEGNLKDSIRDLAARHDIDLIVMGTVGATGLKEKLLGSKTASLIGKTDVPLIVVPDEYTWAPPANMLFLTSHFEEDPGLLDLVFEMAGMFLSRVQVGLFSDDFATDPDVMEAREERLEQYQAWLREKYHDDTLKATHLSGEFFEDTLQDYIADNNIDMIVMVTYRRGFFERLINPSATKRMAYHTAVPLLAIPAETTHHA